MFSKNKSIVSKKYRDAARGEDCTFQIAGVCRNRIDTTVLCHLPDESHGMAQKSDDISAAIGCCDCHDAIDGRNGSVKLSSEDKEFYMRRAQVRTLRVMYKKGLLSIKGA